MLQHTQRLRLDTTRVCVFVSGYTHTVDMARGSIKPYRVRAPKGSARLKCCKPQLDRFRWIEHHEHE